MMGSGFRFLAIILITFAAYSLVLRADFIWDDDGHVTKQELASGAGLGRLWGELGASQQYYPFLHSLFWLEHRAWGRSALHYHVINVAWHALAACLLVVLLRKLAVRAAWLAGLIFAVHPVHVESVAWISEQKNTVSTILYLTTALAYLRFDRDRRRPAYAVALVLFILAVATKSVTATLPAAMLVIFWWKRGRIGWTRDVLPLVPFFALALAAGTLTALVERHYIGAQGEAFSLSPWSRGLLAGRVAWFYAGKLLWPANLTFVYPKWDVNPAMVGQYLFPIAALGLLGGLVAAVWASRRCAVRAEKLRGVLAGILFFGGTLFPALGFLNVYPFKFSYVADHFQYLPSIGLITLGASGLWWAGEYVGLALAATAPVFAGAVTALAIMTFAQSRYYRNDLTLFTATLARNPGCWLAHNILGLELDKIPGRMAGAMAHYEEAIRLNPKYPEALTNLGADLGTIPGRAADAIATLRQALRIRPDYVEAHINLANLLLQTPEGLRESISHYQDALRQRPNAPVVHYNLANALIRLAGRRQEALDHYAKAVSLNPTFLEARFNFAVELATMPNRAAEAVTQYQAVLELKPDFVQAHLNLAEVYLSQNRTAEAVAHLREAQKLDPGNNFIRGRLESVGK